ncbi:ground-like domain protein [Teladorsagia circumcincta]|uniref:Ground-like domain protein n=1 Tax=Teladorsagia circumcincta TaxID=45464 RepID=A0A2G9UMQ4_TELCI|nr:ground-like domain protein [Teladorsagia circumcincta]
MRGKILNPCKWYYTCHYTNINPSVVKIDTMFDLKTRQGKVLIEQGGLMEQLRQVTRQPKKTLMVPHREQENLANNKIMIDGPFLWIEIFDRSKTVTKIITIRRVVVFAPIERYRDDGDNVKEDKFLCPLRYETAQAGIKPRLIQIFAADSVEEEMEATCNNKKLRVIIEDNMTTDPTISKRAIQKAAEEKLRGKFNVICAKGDFTYIAYTDTFCQASNEDVTCYAFKPM